MKQIEITAGDHELKFNVTLADYDRFVNETMPNNKVAPAKNFLNRTANDECKDAVKELCAQGMAMELAAVVIEEYKPKIDFAVKTRSAELKA